MGGALSRLRPMTVPAAATALPVLDIGPFLADETSPAATAFVAELGRVVHEIGFFYVVGHGIPPELADAAHDVARAFFALPEDDRLAIENVESPQFRGYTRFGHERTNGRADLRDQLDIGRELPEPVLGPDDRRGCGCAGPTCGRPRCPSCARSPPTGWTTSRRSARRCCGPWRWPSSCPPTPSPSRHAARGAAQGHPLPHPGDDESEPGGPDADGPPGRRAPTATPASCRSCTRTRSAGCRSSATAG